MKTITLVLIATASLLHAAEPEDWWAFKPLKHTIVPQPKDAGWAKTDIDRFVLAALEAKGLSPTPDADSLTLLRRLSFDLTLFQIVRHRSFVACADIVIPAFGALGVRRAAELAGPHDQRVAQKSARGEVGEQAVEGHVHLGGAGAEV